MAHHPISHIDKLERQLQERFNTLLTAMRGRDVSDEQARNFNLSAPCRSVVSSDVRVSVDDFKTVLNEVRSSLGKR